MSVLTNMKQRINDGEFIARIAFPSDRMLFSDPVYKALVKREHRCLNTISIIKESMRELKSDYRKLYDEDSSAQLLNFRTVIEDAFGMKEHPKRDTLWNVAYEDGHSEGFLGILSHYDKLMQLFI